MPLLFANTWNDNSIYPASDTSLPYLVAVWRKNIKIKVAMTVYKFHLLHPVIALILARRSVLLPGIPVIETLVPIALFAFSTSITPGPNNLMIMSSGLNYGIGRSTPHMMGIWLGFPAMIIAIGLGMGAVLNQFPFLHEIIRWVGIAYMLYLAWLIGSTREMNSDSTSRPLSFTQAMAFQWVNPKGWIMGTGALAAFTSPGTEIWLGIVKVALAFFAIGGPCVAVWLFFGVGLKRFLTEPRYLRCFNITMGLLLAASVVPLALEGFFQFGTAA